MATALSLKDRLLGLVKRYGQSAQSIVQATLAVVPGAAALAPLIDHAFQQLEHAAQEHWEDKLLQLTQANRQQLEQSLRLLELLDERFAVLLAHAQDAARRGQDIEQALRHLLQHDRDLQHGLEHLTDRLDGKLDAQMDSLRHIQEQLQCLLDARQVPTAAEAAPGISIANEAELAFLQQAKTMFRNAPAGLVSRQQWAALGDALAGAGDWAAAQQAHAQAAVAARHALDRTAEAEAAYKQFKDAAEAADWSAAHAALLRAIELDPERFRPTPEHYVIEAVLGAGSFGVVLKCRNPISFDWDGNEELLAVKTFHESDLARPVKDLFLEANALKQLSHPNIIGVREFGYVGGVGKRPYLAMEYFEGQTLQAKLDRDGPLTVADFLAIFEPIAAALHFAHSVGGGKRPIIHRDLKPANVLIRQQADGWQVKVIDFGLAVPARLHATSLTKPQGMRSTRERTITGTIKYAPPEQMGERAYPIGPWSDVYAFGMTALESVLGTVRPQTRHWMRLPEEVRDGLRELLERCVDEEYDAADASNGRWHSFEPILAGLRQLKGGTADARRQAELAEQQRRQAEAERQQREADARRQAELAEQQRRQAEAERQQREAEARRQAELSRALPGEIVAAWTKAGAKVGWLRPKRGVLRFVTEEPAEAGDLLAFKFDRWTDGLLARLPVPAVPFGLDLSNTEVTDAGLGELARLSGLQALSLSWTKVTDAGLGELARLSGLQALSLWRTSVTSAGVAKLQQALRGCSIIH
jgi:hypothetical protein